MGVLINSNGRAPVIGGADWLRVQSGGALVSGPSSLLTNLVSYWKLDEASGTRADSVVASANDLTDNNTVTQAAGKIGNAAQFTAANSEYLSRLDNASLSTGDIDFTFALWVYLDSLNLRFILSKGTAQTVTLNEYFLGYYGGISDNFRFGVSNGVGSQTVDATTLGTPSLSTWYLIACWHDSVANTINIQCNNGAVDSASYSGGAQDTTAEFQIGALNTLFCWDGRIDEFGFWKAVLTAGQRTSLYNAGSGVTYPFTGIP